jgi:hypothetical protein
MPAQDDQLDFWASLNGQSTPDFLQSAADTQWNDQADTINAIFARGPSDPRYAWASQQAAQMNAARSSRDWNQLVRDQEQQGSDAAARIDPYTGAINQQSTANDATRAGWAEGQESAFHSANASNGALFNGLEGGRSAADARDAATMDRYGSAISHANSASSQSLNTLQDRYDDYGILQANPYQGDAASNPEDISRQNAAYNQLGGWASGANNISSDAGLVGQQQDVYGQFNDWANGENAISSDPGLVGMQQGVYDDYGQFASGAMDLESQAATAAADPEAVAAQKEALGEFRDRMDPRLTDAERFLYMQSRLSQEQSQRAVRDANYRELERRGMGGSTMALSNLNASSAEASNTRALQDLGANAKAVDRAEKALVNYGNMSSTMREQSFSEDFATKSAADRMAVNNNQQRLQGIAGQGQMATAMRTADDDIKKFNSTQQMEGLKGAGMMANTMRGQDDAMRQGNANRQLQGAEAQGQMATSMRNASDAMNMFNKEQQGIQLRHEDDFNAGQQRDAWTRDTGMNDATQRYAEGLSAREGEFARTSSEQSGRQFDRLNSTTQTGIGLNRDYVEGYDRLADNASQDRRDKMTELGAGADSEYRASELWQRGQRDVDETRRTILTNNDEDRRVADATRYANASSYKSPNSGDKQDPFTLENWTDDDSDGVV